ncbi:Glycerol-3-phosphate O-acyltransferase 2 [Psilocybe cubensis]|uniref:Glycerol-3-phosphate O-acyltransferase 2 n=1 Tax=Psilocybe cubensis TaxID=181762 RepID=A0ACB8HCK1_PSICU|nr:Glycerol-3-phosphate O-acyltransferase 2 [Psilocybe cubensis]KAH9485367.1 Glycerol-3-phosphate O-acyltransferase 2 [Psilocybe cubensis]
MAQSNDTKALHRLIRFISSLAVDSFFHEVRVIGGENVPKDGPIIVTATHHNMMLDPVILSVGFPYQRMLNYWSKASLFKHPVMSWILYSSGNIPVDRKSKDRQVLFKGTIDALAGGGAVALFPEGTSYTEPRIMQVKDGAAWAACEYTKWAKQHATEGNFRDVTIIPVSIVYTNKSKYRSGVIMEFGRPLAIDPYKEQFLSDVDGEPRAAVKRLTRSIERELVSTSINAPDWDTLYAARMARELLWEKDRSINLEDFVPISQTPVYIMGRIGAKLVENEEETQAQNKVAFGLLSSLLIYPAAFFFLWAMFWYTSLGALLAATLVYLFAFGVPLLTLLVKATTNGWLNVISIQYRVIKLLLPSAKRFIAAWRVLVGVWTPKRWDLSMTALSQYTKPRIPPANQWIDRPSTPKPNASETSPATPGSPTDFNLQNEPQVKTRPARRPPSRRLVRHVLRSRVEAVNALASFFDHLTRAGKDKKVNASPHLAQMYGGDIVPSKSGADKDVTEGWRYASEVLTFLKKRGAKIPTLGQGPLFDEWALSSEGEGYTTGEEQEERIWVATNSS